MAGSAQARILHGHTSNQPAEFQRNGRTARPGLVAPQQSPSGAVLTDRRFWPNDHQARAPIAPPRQQGQARPHRGIDTPGFNAALLEERKLATKHQVLGFEGSLAPDREDGQADRIGKQPQNNPGEGNHASSCHVQRWTRQSETHRPKAASPIVLLWPTGDDAARGLRVSIDAWESYLEPPARATNEPSCPASRTTTAAPCFASHGRRRLLR